MSSLPALSHGRCPPQACSPCKLPCRDDLRPGTHEGHLQLKRRRCISSFRLDRTCSATTWAHAAKWQAQKTAPQDVVIPHEYISNISGPGVTLRALLAGTSRTVPPSGSVTISVTETVCNALSPDSACGDSQRANEGVCAQAVYSQSSRASRGSGLRVGLAAPFRNARRHPWMRSAHASSASRKLRTQEGLPSQRRCSEDGRCGLSLIWQKA